MSNTCFACHGPDETTNESGLRLDSFESAVTNSGAIEPGNAANSIVFQRINDVEDPMPPREFRHQLSDDEKELIRKWIEQGAKYETHWSYAPISKPNIPTVERFQDRIGNPIDAFVLEKLESLNIQPTPLADKRTLARRLYLDLIGMPPTPEELSNFLADRSIDAYEKLVDRLLNSPHYGEQMAIRWLDIVRFSDTVGFHGDQNQRIFPYRDYVIDSINRNQPFDEFTIEQLAGDLLDEPSEQQLTATGVIRLNMMTREGGAQSEEYLAKYSADRVRMIGTAWLGATLGCCECHDHKYDPFTIKDFYSMAAFFDDVRQWGVYQNYQYTPNPDLRGFSNHSPFPPELRLKSSSLAKQIVFLEQQLDTAAASKVTQDDLESDRFKFWLQELSRQFANQSQLWTPIELDSVNVQKHEAFELLEDRSVLFSGSPLKRQKIFVNKTVEKPTIVKAVKLQVLPHENNHGLVGRNDGRFSAKLSVKHLVKGKFLDDWIQVRPRFVRIELPGQNKILSLAEVEIYSEDETQNVALNGVVSQSSVNSNGLPELAIDGESSGDKTELQQATLTNTETNPWWEIDLHSEKPIRSINIFNHPNADLRARLNGYRLILLSEDREVLFQTTPDIQDPKMEIKIPRQVFASELAQPQSIAFAQADLFSANRYVNGKANVFLDGNWKSGPGKWQLPLAETSHPHNAVFHLEKPIVLGAGDKLNVTIQSGDMGRFRLFYSCVSRPVVGASSANAQLRKSLDLLTKTSHMDSTKGIDQLAIRSAFYRSMTPVGEQDPRVEELRRDLAECYSGYATTLVTQQTATDRFRQTRVLPRGDWKDKSGAIVSPDTPDCLPGKIESSDDRKTRLDLAAWLVSKENPLTARHYVNRTWKYFFGKGISNVLDDLGNQGEWPRHLELLNWMASEFQSDWDRKKLARLIVTSHTYKQQAGIRRDLSQLDPYNRLLAQQSPRRLQAENVRDNALAIAGLLNTDWVGGPSVFPFQPAGYYANLQFPNRRYVAQANGLQYRRGIYMHWQRTFLHPMLTNFDAPSRDECAADRNQSNSPQQALTLLNDPVFVEAAKAFAMRIVNRQLPDVSAQIEFAFLTALSRGPSPQESQSMQRFYRDQTTYYSEHITEAREFLGRFGDPPSGSGQLASFAAWCQVCRVILNLHEVITRY